MLWNGNLGLKMWVSPFLEYIWYNLIIKYVRRYGYKLIASKVYIVYMLSVSSNMYYFELYNHVSTWNF